jgi:hypothetical protein
MYTAFKLSDTSLSPQVVPSARRPHSAEHSKAASIEELRMGRIALGLEEAKF